MVASGVGQFSLNVKANLTQVYQDISKLDKSMKALTDRKEKLEIDSSNLTKLRAQAQEIAQQMKELRQQKTEIKLGISKVDNPEQVLKNIDINLANLNAKKLKIETDIQPIRTANVDLFNVEKEIDKINQKSIKQTVEIDTKQVSKLDLSAVSDRLKSISDVTDKIGSGFDKMSDKVFTFGKAVGGLSLAGIGGIVTVMKQAVNEASDLEQNTGGIQKLFGDSANAVIKNSQTAYKTAGVSQNEYLEQTTTFAASLIKNLNGNQAEAAKYANTAITDMSDNANVFGTDIGSIQLAYQGFSKGNYTMLDNLKLGFAGSQQGAMDLINTYGGLDHKITDISKVTFPMMVTAVHNAQVSMQIAGDTAREASDTYAGSLVQMQKKFHDFLGTGDTTGLSESISNYFVQLDGKIKELTPKIIAGIKQMAKDLPPKIKPILSDLTKLISGSIDAIFGQGTTQNFIDGMKPFTDLVKMILDNLKQLSGAQKMSNLSWVGSLIPDLLKLGTSLKVASLAFNGVSLFTSISSAITASMGKIGALKSFVSSRITNEVGGGIAEGISNASDAVSSGKSATSSVASAGEEAVGDVGKLGTASKVVGVAGSVVNVVGKAGFMFEGLSILDQVKDTIKNYNLKEIQDLYKSMPDSYPDLSKKIKALQDFSAEMQKVSVNSNIDNDVNTGVNAIGAVGAGLTVAGEGSVVSAIGAGMAVGALMFKGLQLVDDIRENLKMDRIQRLFDLADMLSKFDFSKLTSENISKKISDLTSTLANLYNGVQINTKVKIGDDSTTMNLSGIIEQLSETLPPKSDMNKVVTFLGQLTGIKSSIDKIGDISQYKKIGQSIANLKNGLVDLMNSMQDTGSIDNSVSDFTDAVNAQFSMSDTNAKVDSDGKHTLKGVIDQLLPTLPKKEDITNLTSQLNNLSALATPLGTLNGIKKFDKIKQSIQNLKDGLNTVYQGIISGRSNGPQQGVNQGGTPSIETLIGNLSNTLSNIVLQLPNIKTALDNFAKIGTTLSGLNGIKIDGKDVTNKMNIIKGAISMLEGVSTSDNVKNLTGMSGAFDTIIKDLTSKFPPEFNQFGKNLANQVNSGFNEKLALPSLVQKELGRINVGAFNGLGQRIANQINSGVLSNLNIGEKIKATIESALNQGFQTTVTVNYAEGTNTVPKITDVIGNQSTATIGSPGVGNGISNIGGFNKTAVTTAKTIKASGGLITRDNSMIMDSPEKPVLGNGEYVIPKKIVDTLGVPFFEKIRHGQVSRTFAGLAQRVSNSTSSVVNNVYNNNNENTQNLNLYTTGQQDFVLQANRKFRTI